MSSPLDERGTAEPQLRSAWAVSSPEPALRPALQGAAEAEIAVVGGGVAGLSTALHLAESIRPPLLLEAGAIGDGATGASAGVIAPQLIRATPHAVLARLGQMRGEATLRLISESGQYLFELADRYGIACRQSAGGFLAPATGRSAHRRLSDIITQWRGFRDDLTLCDAVETERLSGCRGYSAAILHQSGGAIDPLLYVRGLADRAEALGTRIHENSRVAAIERRGSHWELSTAQGRIKAHTVVLAANGSNGELHPALRGTVLPLPVCEVLTEPLPQDMRAAILPQRHSLTDLEPDVFSIRYALGDRLITALPARRGQSAARIEQAVNRRLAQMLVVHRPLRLDQIWHGFAWVNGNLLPRLVKVESGMVAIQACNGRGLGTNTVFGRELARALVGSDTPDSIGFEAPHRVSGFVLARHVPRLLMSVALVAKRFRRRVLAR